MRADDTGGDERFERDLRSVLRDLAVDPAPDRLVERVRSIPFRAPASAPRPSLMTITKALATAAVLVVVAGVMIMTRPSGGSPIGGPPGASGSPGASVNGSSPSPSAVPSQMGSVVPPSAAAGGPVPSGFQAVSVTFASPDLGWVLGAASCPGGPCTSIVRTSDAGRTWAAIPAPPAPVSGSGLEPVSGTGVSGLRFADPLDGWAFGPDLWATHDGGATWHRVMIPGMASAPVVALEASAGSVYAVLYETAPQPAVRIASSAADHDGWRLSPVSVQIGAGPVPSTQLVLSGASGWLLQVDRTVVGGLRLTGGAWTAWTPPCADLVGPAVLAASSPAELVAACDVGLWSTPQGEHLYVSHDGGTTFAEAVPAVPLDEAAAVASPGPESILMAGTASQGTAIVGSFDGGRTWQAVLTTGEPGGQAALFTYLGFTTTTQGVAITQSGTGTSNGTSQGTLWMTRDGGHTWAKVSFGR